MTDAVTILGEMYDMPVPQIIMADAPQHFQYTEPVLNLPHIITQLILTVTLRGRKYLYFHFTDEKTGREAKQCTPGTQLGSRGAAVSLPGTLATFSMPTNTVPTLLPPGYCPADACPWGLALPKVLGGWDFLAHTVPSSVDNAHPSQRP